MPERVVDPLEAVQVDYQQCHLLARALRLSNRLLALLPAADLERLRPHLHPVDLTAGEAIYDAGRPPDWIYFPTTAVVSFVHTTESGATTQIGVVGNEGVLGLAVLLGARSLPDGAIVQIAGEALRARVDVVAEEFWRGGAFQRLMLRYLQTLMTQISQTAACNQMHSVEQRLCRWLLLCLDRVESDRLTMTQEFLAGMLGDRRESVTLAAGNLQSLGLMQYARGHILVLDRAGLEARACECYEVVRSEIARLLSGTDSGAKPDRVARTA
jgi:CRP-like cAMP-binding protein